MKKLTTLFFLSVLTISLAFGQNKLSEKELLGTWKMTIEMDEVVSKLQREAKDADTMLEEILLKTVSGVMESVMDKVEIYIDFERGGDANIVVEAFGEETKENNSKWSIKSGRLYIEGSNNNRINWDGDDYWILKDGVLFLEEDDRDEDKVTVYMVRIKD